MPSPEGQKVAEAWIREYVRQYWNQPISMRQFCRDKDLHETFLSAQKPSPQKPLGTVAYQNLDQKTQLEFDVMTSDYINQGIGLLTAEQVRAEVDQRKAQRDIAAGRRAAAAAAGPVAQNVDAAYGHLRGSWSDLAPRLVPYSQPGQQQAGQQQAGQQQAGHRR